MGGQWETIVPAVLSVFAVIGVGATVRRIGWLSEEADRSLMKLIIHLLLPCLIFSSASDNPALKEAGNLLLPPLIGFGTCAVGLAAAMLVVRLSSSWHGLEDPAQRRTFATCVGIYNYGFIPIPLVKVLFPYGTLGVLFVHNLGVNVAVWTIAVMLLSGTRGRQGWRQLINAPTMAILAAVSLNLLGVGQHLPKFLSTTVDWLGQAAIPVSLILIGATMADQVQIGSNGRDRRQAAKAIGWACVLRLGLLPLVFLTIAALVPASTELRQVIVVEAAMPSAVFPVVMARHYGGHPATALRVALSTSIVSLLTIPLWITAGMHWLAIGTGGS